MKEFLIVFFLCLIIGSFINGYKDTQQAKPESPSADKSDSKSDQSTLTSTSETTFHDDVLNKGNTPVLVDFYADWCGPCKMMTPIMNSVNKDYAGRAQLYKVNVDQNPTLSEKYEIKSIPAFLVFKNGKVVENLSGMQSKDAINTALDKHLGDLIAQ